MHTVSVALSLSLSVVLLTVAGCSEKSQLFCSVSQTCEVGLPVCDVEGICPSSDYVANTCILEACWDASVPDAAPSGVDGGADALVDECARDLDCPAALEGNTTLCGRIRNAADSMPLLGDGTATLCNAAQPAASGPCAIQLSFFASLDYMADPSAAAPASRQSLVVDGCGRYVAQNIPTPVLGLLLIEAKDYAAQDAFVTTATSIMVSPGLAVRHDLLALDHATDQAWTTGAGDPFEGSTFSEVGTALETFHSSAGPHVGVSTGDGRSYYFLDTSPTSRSMLTMSPQNTGGNGSALSPQIGTAVTRNPGGGEPDGCSWRHGLFQTVPGVLVYIPHIAIDGDGNPC